MSDGLFFNSIRGSDFWIFNKTIIAIFLALWIYWLWSRKKFYALSMKMPGPKAYPIIGNALDIGIPDDAYGFVDYLLKMAIKYKNNFRLWFGPELMILMCDSEDLESLLMSKASVIKDKRYDMFKLLIGDGLLISSGNIWKKHRHIINPSFNMATLRSYQPFYNSHSKRIVESLDKICCEGSIDPSKYCKRYIADVVTETVFGESFEFYKGKLDDLIEISVDVVEKSIIRMTRFWLELDIIYKLTKDWKHSEKSMKKYRNVYHERLKAKLKNYIDKNEHFESAADEEESKHKKVQTTFEVMANAIMKGEITEQELYDEFDNIFNPGLETTYSNICMFLMMMAMHKDCQKKLIEEIDDFYGDVDSDVTQDDFRNLPYLDMCLKEVTRLYPTGPVITRHLLEDFKLKNGITIPGGTNLMISLYVLHRDPKYWENPNSFQPERFSKENSKGRPHFAYVPFLAGQRNCIGQRVAIDAVKTGMIHILRKFEFHSDLKIENLKLKADVSTRSAMGYNVNITRRQKK